MLNAIIRFALRYRPLILVASLAGLVGGGYLSSTLPIDVFPDLDRPRVVLLTECPGLATEEVETLVSAPLEQALLGANGVRAVRSESVAGLSTVRVEFAWNADVHRARQVVQERLASVQPDLPPGVRPQMAPLSSLMGQIMLVGLSYREGGADSKRQMELRTLADWVIRPRLRKIPGVAQVVIMGGGRKQYQVLADPRALLDCGVTLYDVEQALRESNPSASGGFLEQGDGELPLVVKSRLGPDSARVLAQLRQVPVKNTRERPILLGQVARVVEAPQTKRGDASVDGRPGVLLTVTKQPHADTRRVTAQVEEALRELDASLPANVVVNTEVFQLKGFIDRGLYNVGEALVVGAVLVLIVLFLFLLNFRTTFISLTAIPLSLAITALVFRAVGWLTGTSLTINVMTLGGIAVALGELVDDAVVDVENIFRRLRENNALAMPRPALLVIYEASKEIRSAIVFGTMMVILVFLPLFALSGVEGRLFAPLGVAYIVSILASLLVSLTVTPVLSSYLLPQARATHRAKDSPLLRGLKGAAGYLIRFSMRRAGTLLVLTWLLVGLSFWMLTRLGSDFLPPFDEGSIQVNVVLPPGCSLAASREAAARVEARLERLRKTEENPDGAVLHYVRRTGRAELDEHADPVNNTEYVLSMNPALGRQRDEVIKELLQDLQGLKLGASVEVEQPLAHLISHMLSASRPRSPSRFTATTW